MNSIDKSFTCPEKKILVWNLQGGTNDKMKDIQFPIRHSSSFSSAASKVTCAFIRSLSFGSQTKLIWITHIFPWESTSPRIQNDVYEDEYTPSVLYHLLRFSSFLNYFSRHWKKKVSQHLYVWDCYDGISFHLLLLWLEVKWNIPFIFYP